MLRRMMGRKRKTGTVPVYLNVYDLTPINGYAYWLGLGIYHSGVQVHGVEYAFGAHEHSTTGIFEVEPKHCPGFTFRKSILIARSDLGPKEVRALMEKLAEEYPGNSYNLISRNCNHFCNDVCLRLAGKQIPSWVNRLARLGMHPYYISELGFSCFFTTCSYKHILIIRMPTVWSVHLAVHNYIYRVSMRSFEGSNLAICM